MNKTGTLHFTIGNGLGNVLHEISTENLYRFDIDKAITTWTKSIIGMEESLAKELVFGLKKLSYKDGEISISDNKDNKIPKTLLGRIKSLFIVDYPEEDNVLYLNDILIELDDYLLKEDVISIETESTEDEPFDTVITHNSDSYRVIKYIFKNGFIPDLIEDNQYQVPCYNRLHDALVTYDLSKKVIDNYKNINKIFDIMSELNIDIKSVKSFVTREYSKFIKTYNKLTLKFDINIKNKSPEQQQKLDKFKVGLGLTPGNLDKDNFGPVDITHKYDAGLLSPDGVFFGMYGVTANLMHMHLSDNIVKYYNLPPSIWWKSNNDGYLLYELNYVKITHNRVEYFGWDDIGDTHKTDMTQKQIDAICEMADKCYNGIFSLSGGEEICTTRFRQMDKLAIRNLFKYK